MKIYTKTGDDGSTGLLGGQRITKADARIQCFGEIDELNAALGVAAVAAVAGLLPLLQQVQSDLFLIGSHLAAPTGKKIDYLPPLNDQMTTRLETQIDTAEAQLSPLQNFILPGGSELAARLHLARTLCRRAERTLVAHATDLQIQTLILVYINRLSDWLFVQARRANAEQNIADIPWHPAK